MQTISRSECMGLLSMYKVYPKVSVIQGEEKQERDSKEIPSFLNYSTEILTDANLSDDYITIDIFFVEDGKKKTARVLLS